MKDTKKLYEHIMASVAKEIKKALNETVEEMSPSEKMDAWHNGDRDENIKACGADKLKKYKAICKAKGYDAEVAAIDAEIKKRGLKESAIFENEDIPTQFGPEFEVVVRKVLDHDSIDIDTDADIMFDALCEASGESATVGGELLRAAERIAYRYWNDGDKAGEGYGRETVNPAVRYMEANVTRCEGCNLLSLVEDLFNGMERGGVPGTDEEYEKLTQNILRETVIYIVLKKAWNIPNHEDMWDYKDDDKDVDRDDWEDEDWEDEDW